MNEHDAINASGFLPTHMKSRIVSSAIRLLSSSGRLPADASIDRQRIEKEEQTMRERIRQAIVADKSLSLYAQNIKILVGPKGVTLYGSVKSQEESKRIESGAAAVIKVGKVFSKLIVRPSQTLNLIESSRRHKPNEQPSTDEECGRIRRLWGIRERSGR